MTKHVVGNKYGKWTLIEYPRGSRKVKVVCECGTEQWSELSNLYAKGKSRSTQCRNCSARERSQKLTENYSESWQKRRIYQIIKAGASQKTFELTEEQVWELVKQNCYYCGQEPSNTHNTGYFVIKYNGIDRIDSSRHYIENNVRTSCWKCNSAKKDMSEKDFEDWLERIYKHYRGERTPLA